MTTRYFSRRRLPTLLNVAVYVHLNRDENGRLRAGPRAGATRGGRRRRHIAYGFDDNGVVGLYHNRSTMVRLVLVRYSGDDLRNVKMLGEIRKIQFFNARLNDTKNKKSNVDLCR